jgi:DNA-binding MarR family transcriptional regulator
VKHPKFEAGQAHSARLKDEALGVRERLHHLLRSLDDLVEPSQVNNPATVERVRGMLKIRRLRERFFEASLFADPAWDILLELYMAELAQYRLSVSSLAIGAAVPATTALRWIKTLEKRGLLDRNPDPGDGRRTYVSLSTKAVEKMERLFECMPTSGLQI